LPLASNASALSDRILVMRGFGDLFGKHLASLLENAIRFCAAMGRGRAVAAKHREFEDNLVRLPRPPACYGKFAGARFRFSSGDCLAELGARVEGKRPAANSQDDVADKEHALGRRTLLHLRDGNLPRIGGHQLVAKHPPAQPRGAEIPAMLCLRGNGIGLGQVGNRQRLAAGRGWRR
jgi:hypothetical protein